MKRIAIILLSFLMISTAIAQPPREITVMPLGLIERSMVIPVDIMVNGSIGIENTSLTYEHRIANPTNESLRLVFTYYFWKKPRLLSVLVNGEKAVLETVSEDKYRSKYRLTIPLEKNETVEVSSKMDYFTMPSGRYRLGLWGNYYAFDTPISIDIEHLGLRMPIYLYGSIKGEIRLLPKIKKVNCRDCKYYEKGKVIRINIKEKAHPSFSFDFQTKRTPVKAGVFYILMLVLIFGFAVRERMKK